MTLPKNRFGITFATLVLAITVLPHSSTWADRPDFMVNDLVPGTAQVTPRIASAGTAGFVVVWSDDRTGNADVWLQKFDYDANRLGENFATNSDANGAYQASPAIGIDYTANYAVVWQDYRNGPYPFKPDIFFQGYDALLSPLGLNTELTLTLPDTLKGAPDIDMAPWGNGVVVWSDYRNRQWDIYGQRLTASGTLIGGPFKINDDAGIAQQHAPRVGVSSQGWFVVTWYDNRAGHDDIFAQVYDSSGAKKSVNFRVNSDNTTSRQAFPDIAADGMGRFTIVWVDWRNGAYPNNPDIFARKFDTMLTVLSEDRKINNDSENRAQRDPAIAADRRGNVAIIWADSTAGSWDVLGQMIDVDGLVREPNFRANSLGDSAQLQPSVALDGRRRYVAWVDRRNGEHDIYASVSTYNSPNLVPSVTSLNFLMESGGALPSAQTVQLDHAGYNPLHYQAVVDQQWLTVLPSTGVTPTALSVAINTSDLARGTYPATVRLIDTDNNDSSTVIAVTLTVAAPILADTVMVSSASAIPGAPDSVRVTLASLNDLKELTVPLIWDTTVIDIDSIRFDTSWLPDVTRFKQLSIADGHLVLNVNTRTQGTEISAGSHVVAILYLTGKRSGAFAVIDTTTVDSFFFSAVTTDNLGAIPVFRSGRVTLSSQTDVKETPLGVLPQVYALRQNYPNPFNGRTVIEYDLPSPSAITLEVFNILGQRVALIASGARPAGIWRASWDGRSDDGRELPSGAYFYRLQAGHYREVRKLVLLK